MPGKKNRVIGLFFVLIGLGVVLTGCSGAKVLEEPKSMPLVEPLAVTSNENLSLVLDWVIVRDGPGAWAKNADWDEYLLRVLNLSNEEVVIASVSVYDSLGGRQRMHFSREGLVRSSREQKKRYKDQGLTVKAGVGGDLLVLAGGAAWVAGSTAGVVSAVTLGAYTGAAVAGIALAPVLVGTGIAVNMRNNKVDKEIFRRYTAFPFRLEPGEGESLDVFFPLAPSPTKLELGYMISGRDYSLTLDVGEPLNGLHLVPE